MSRFIAPVNESLTRTVPLGPCECPGSPHKDGDTAEVYRFLGWDDLLDVGVAANQSAGAGTRVLVTRAIASWTLEELNGDGTNHPVPVTESTVRLLNQASIDAVSVAVNEAYENAKAPLPNVSGEESPPSQPEPDTSILTTPQTAKPTS